MNQLNNKQRSRVLFYGLLGVLLSLCFIRYSLQINIPVETMLAVAVLIAVMGDKDEIIAMCVCCIPLYTSIQYPYVLFICMGLYLLKFSADINFNLTILPVVLMIVWELLHCFGAPFAPIAFVNDCLPLLLLVLLMCSGKTKFDYDFIVRALAISVAAMCLCLLGRLLYTARFDVVAALSGLRRLGLDSSEVKGSIEITGGQQNPNTLGILCVLVVSGLMQLRNAGRGKHTDGLLMVFLLLFGAMTSSRTFLACLAIMVVLLIAAQKGSLSQKLKFIGGVVLIILLALALLYLLLPDLLEYYYGRFFVEDISTGRADLMTIYHNYIVSNPKVLLFGIGLHDFVHKIVNVYRISNLVPHNGIQELIVAWGIPGVALFVYLWLTMIFRARRVNPKLNLLHFIPFIVLMAKIQAGQMLDSPYTMLAFSYCYLSMANVNTTVERKMGMKHGFFKKELDK